MFASAVISVIFCQKYCIFVLYHDIPFVYIMIIMRVYITAIMIIVASLLCTLQEPRRKSWIVYIKYSMQFLSNLTPWHVFPVRGNCLSHCAVPPISSPTDLIGIFRWGTFCHRFSFQMVGNIDLWSVPIMTKELVLMPLSGMLFTLVDSVLVQHKKS